jgi:hypothetical protein
MTTSSPGTGQELRTLVTAQGRLEVSLREVQVPEPQRGGRARGGMLVGRDAETTLIAARLADLDAGTAILVRGAAGIGKTALVDEAMQLAGASRHILHTVGHSPETGMAMAGLYQLLQPVLHLAHSLPEPRQTALRVAFGITGGAPPEPFVLAAATLDLLTDAAAEQPLLLVAEDVHWLDPGTIGVLRFIGRRLDHDPVVLVATSRDDPPGRDPRPASGQAWLLTRPRMITGLRQGPGRG